MRGGFLRLGLRDARHRLPFGEGLSEGRGKTMSEENKEVAGKEAVSAAGIPGVGGGGGESVDWRRRAEETVAERLPDSFTVSTSVRTDTLRFSNGGSLWQE